MRNKRVKSSLLNLLIAIVISLVVNFSYLVFMMIGTTSDRQADEPRKPKTENIAPDYGKSSSEAVQAGSLAAQEDVAEGGLSSEIVIREESITKLTKHHNRTNPLATSHGRAFMLLDMLFYVVVAMVFLSTMTLPRRRGGVSYWWRIIICVGALVVFYMLSPQLTWEGNIIITANTRRLFNPMLLLKLLATFFVSVLYGVIYQMQYKQQEIRLENERLKNENLAWQYNTLVNQVNPHFLFNSLNSLSMLVREEQIPAALNYIDRLSDTYRYIIQDGTAEMTSVEKELRFVEAYKYMLEVRYAGKLSINVNVAEEYNRHLLPPLSIQPLIENAVKHNTISSQHPMTINIASEGNYIVVTNTKTPKIEAEKSTGIGLVNLANRYKLLTGRDVVVNNGEDFFVVKLPLMKA